MSNTSRLDIQDGDFVTVQMAAGLPTVGVVEDYRGPHCFGVRSFRWPLNLPALYHNARMIRCHAPRVPDWENPQW